MKLFSKCMGCKQVKVVVRVRKYKSKIAGILTSKDEVCRECYRRIKKLIS